MKTLLFAMNGSYSHTNLAIRAIGASLKRNNFEVVLLERNLKDAHDGVLSALYEAKADVYGFSVYIWNVTEMLRLASEVKLLLPEARIVFGGPEVSFYDERFFAEHPFADYIIAGEGEDAFPMLLSMIGKGNAPRIFMAEPFAAFCESGIYYDEIGDAPQGLVYYESVRGCPFSCAYCLSAGEHRIRAKSAERALADLLKFEKFDGIRTVKLVDRTFNFDAERAKTIWRALSGDAYTKEYHFEVSAALLDDESIEILRQAPRGKFRLEIGVQSTNPETVRAVSRRLDTAKTLSALEKLHEGGNLHLHADLIAGLPYEDMVSFEKSFNDVYGKADALQAGFLKLLRGSAMRKDAGKYGIVYSPAPPYKVLCTTELSHTELALLESISGMTERFSDSGRFKNSFPYLPLCRTSAFAFFAEMVRTATELFGTGEAAKLSQTNAYLLVLETARRCGVEEQASAKARLALDYLLCETRRLPSFLTDVLVTGEAREALLCDVPSYRRAAFEVVYCEHLCGYALVDREKKTVTVKVPEHK